MKTKGDLALVMTGGGARAAYQAGFMHALAKRHPQLNIDIFTGSSAGAINAAFLASLADEPLVDRTKRLQNVWANLEIDNVFRADSWPLLRKVFSWAFQFVSGGSSLNGRIRGLVDTSPLHEFLSKHLKADDRGVVPGIERHIASGRLKAIAVTTVSYDSGCSVTWVEGKDIETWERAGRTSRQTELNVAHVMASAALPLFFPAVGIGNHWYGDGGIRLTAPLAPSVHLGAERILAISTRYLGSGGEAERSGKSNYPPPAQVIGTLTNSIFLDLLNEDALRLERINSLLKSVPEDKREGVRPIELMVVRPSVDLGKLANDFEAKLPGMFRFLTRGFGTRQTRSNDALSMVMFQQDYVQRLIEIGAADAEAQADRIAEFLGTDIPKS